jgi:hypothetical protein
VVFCLLSNDIVYVFPPYFRILSISWEDFFFIKFLRYNLVSNSLGENVFTALVGFVSLTNQTFNFSSYEGFVFIMYFIFVGK